MNGGYWGVVGGWMCLREVGIRGSAVGGIYGWWGLGERGSSSCE